MALLLLLRLLRLLLPIPRLLLLLLIPRVNPRRRRKMVDYSSESLRLELR